MERISDWSDIRNPNEKNRIGSDVGFFKNLYFSDRIRFRISDVGQKIRSDRISDFWSWPKNQIGSDFGFSFLLKFRIGSDFGFAFFYKFRIRSDFRLAYFPKCSDGIGFQIFKFSKKIMIGYDFEFTIYKKISIWLHWHWKFWWLFG